MFFYIYISPYNSFLASRYNYKVKYFPFTDLLYASLRSLVFPSDRFAFDIRLVRRHPVIGEYIVLSAHGQISTQQYGSTESASR